MANNTQAPQGADMTHRKFFDQFFQEAGDDSLNWAPVLDDCLRAYFLAQGGLPAEGHPMQMMLDLGYCMGITKALLYAGLITGCQRSHLDEFAKRRTYEKATPWNGHTITISAGPDHFGCGAPPAAPSALH